MLEEALSHAFFQRAVIAAVLASISCGIVGSYVVVKKVTSISGGLAHAAFGGIGLGYLLGISPMLGALLFGVACALLIGVVYFERHEGLDTLVSMIWALGMALGVICISLTPGYAPDLHSYLFGNLILVSREYLILVGLLDLLIVGVVLLSFNHFQAVAFDEEFAEVSGLPARITFLGSLMLTTLVVVTLIRVVGIILTIALLTTPAAIARHWVSDLKRMIFMAIAISAVCTLGGLVASYWISETYTISLPVGPVIIVFAVLLYTLSALLSSLSRRSE